jgi:hypothetical protein
MVLFTGLDWHKRRETKSKLMPSIKKKIELSNFRSFLLHYFPSISWSPVFLLHSSSGISHDLENVLNLITYTSLYKDVMLIIQLQLRY